MILAALAWGGWASSALQAPSMTIAHPEVPCWSGERSWTAPGEPISDTVSYDTRGDARPFLITHKRDQLRDGQEVVQDYNFIDYWFGDPASPLHARHYLRDDGVFVTLPHEAGEKLTLDEVRARFPSDVLCYLQKRFDRIEVLLQDGYQEIWSRPQ